MERVPDIFIVNDLGTGAGDDAKKTKHQLDERQEGNLPIYTVVLLEIASEVGDVGGHFNIVSSSM